MQNTNNNEKVVAITGASRGIGKSILEQMAKSGYKVVGTATSQKGVDSINQNIQSLGASGKAYVLDVSILESIENFISEVNHDFAAIWTLVNNAAITSDQLFIRMKIEEWSRVIKTNLDSVFSLTQGFIRVMIKKRAGRIINISSVVGSSGNAGQVNYSASKSALFGFSKSLAQEVGSRGITVNCIAPGFIQTDMTDKLTDTQREKLLSRIPLKSLGQVEDIARGAVFLASDDARYITGQTLHINGGLYMV